MLYFRAIEYEPKKISLYRQGGVEAMARSIFDRA
jgi:hypothetical protein